MSMNEPWMTKEEVLLALGDATGLDVYDEDYVVRGARPPPQRRDIDDEELRLRYGGDGDTNAPLDEVKLEPDLVGITQMLRMVEDTAEPDQRVDWRKNSSSNPFGESAAVVLTKKSPPSSSPQNWRERNSPRSDSDKTSSNPSGEGAAVPITKNSPLPASPQNWRERNSPSDTTNCNSLVTPPPGFTWKDRKAPRDMVTNTNIVASSILNPEVPIFVPGVASDIAMPVCQDNNISNGQMAAIGTDKNTNGNNYLNVFNTDVGNDLKASTSKETIVSKTNKSVTSRTSANDEKILTEMLKKKIVEASKADRKWEKNVAMAALLRLKTSPRDSVVSSKAQSPIPVKDQDESVGKEKLLNIIKTSTFTRTDSPNNIVLFTPEYYESNIKVETLKSENTSPRDIELEKRVIDWIDDTKSDSSSPKPVKSPVKPREKLKLITKPIGFIRKPVTLPVKSSLPQSTKLNKVTDTIPCYVPTRNATILAQYYEGAMKEEAKPVQSCGFLTEALLQQLKAKDEEFKKRNEKNETVDNDSLSSTTQRRRR